MRILTVICLATCLSGCTSETTHVQGFVTMGDKPAESGYVTFRASDPSQPAFTLHCDIDRGRYSSELENRPLPPGNYEVRVAVTKQTGRRVPLPGAPDGQTQDEVVVISAAEYNGSKSPLRYQHAGKEKLSTFNISVPAAR